MFVPLTEKVIIKTKDNKIQELKDLRDLLSQLLALALRYKIKLETALANVLTKRPMS